MSKLIRRTVDIVFIGLMALIAYVIAANLSDYLLPGVSSYAVALVLVVAVGFILVFLRPHLLRIGYKIKHSIEPIPAWKLALFLGVFSAVTKIILVFLFDNNADFHPDMAMYRSFAEQYAMQGKITEHAEYAVHYPYTAFYGWILSPLAVLFGADTKVFTTALSVLHSVAMVMLFDILKPYTKKETAFCVLLLYCILPVGLMQTQLLTHENALFFFHVSAVWLFMKAFRDDIHWFKQVLFVFGAAALLSVGKGINAAGFVFLISFALYAIAKCFFGGINFRKSVRVIVVFLALLVCYSASNLLVGSLRADTVKMVGETKKDIYYHPYGWGLYLGMNYDSAGMWNQEDYDTYYRYTEFDNKEDAVEYQKDLLSERWQLYEDNPAKIPMQLLKKLRNLWGAQMLPYAYEQGNSITEFLTTGWNASIHKAFIVLTGVACLILSLIILIAKWKSLRYRKDTVTPDLHFNMCVIGVTFALMLVEVTPKYASHLHICLFVSLAFVLKYFFSPKAKEKANKN